jgi:hypothetical protein
VHPELDWLLFVKIEQHAMTFRQFLAVHQTHRPLGGIGRKLDGEGMDPGPGHDLDRVLPAGAGCRRDGEKRRADNQRDSGEPRDAIPSFGERLKA